MIKPINYPDTNLYSFSDDLINKIISLTAERSYKKGEYIFRQDDPAKGIHIVKTGQVILKKTYKDGSVYIYDYLAKGHFLGETSFFSDLGHFCDALTATKASIYFLDQAKIEQIQSYSTEFESKMLKFQSQLIHMLTVALDLHAIKPAEQRLAMRLMFFLISHGVETPHGMTLDIVLSQESLAQTVGLSRQLINKFLNKWKEEKIVDQHDRKLVILDYGKLKALATA